MQHWCQYYFMKVYIPVTVFCWTRVDNHVFNVIYIERNVIFFPKLTLEHSGLKTVCFYFLC